MQRGSKHYEQSFVEMVVGWKKQNPDMTPLMVQRRLFTLHDERDPPTKATIARWWRNHIQN